MIKTILKIISLYLILAIYSFSAALIIAFSALGSVMANRSCTGLSCLIFPLNIYVLPVELIWLGFKALSFDILEGSRGIILSLTLVPGILLLFLICLSNLRKLLKRKKFTSDNTEYPVP